MLEKIVKCPICGQPYKIYAYYAGDQSACRTCQFKAQKQNPGDLDVNRRTVAKSRRTVVFKKKSLL